MKIKEDLDMRILMFVNKAALTLLALEVAMIVTDKIFFNNGITEWILK